MKKRPFYKAIEGYWGRIFLFLLIVLIAFLLHLVSLKPVAPEPLLRPVAEEPPSAEAPAGEVETGTATINLSVHDGKFSIRDLSTNELVVTGQQGSEVFDLPPGKYQVEFEDIFGYQKPDTSVFTLAPKQELTVNCNYKNTQTPFLRIQVNPGHGQYRLFDPTGKVLTEVTGAKDFSYPPGMYRIFFLPIDGYVAPGTKNFELRRGITTTVNGVYDPQ